MTIREQLIPLLEGCSLEILTSDEMDRVISLHRLLLLNSDREVFISYFNPKNKIQIIKAIREVANMGLKDAMETLEQKKIFIVAFEKIKSLNAYASQLNFVVTGV